ncbi:MAG: DUF4388 domain-containing protein [Acidobacteriota bacterium]
MSVGGQSEFHLAVGDFPAILRRLVRELAVGRLAVTSGGQTREIWLEAGKVLAAVSEDEEEKFGAWLVARSVLEPQQISLALLRQPEGVKLGAYLVQEGLLDFDVLQRELGAQAAHIVGHMLIASGSCAFQAGQRLPAELAPLPMSSGSLLMGAVRAVERIEQLASLLDSEKRLVAVDQASLQPGRTQLEPAEAFLLSRIDGATNAAQLRRLVPLPAEEVTRALVALLVAGLVETQGERAARSGPPSARPATKSQDGEMELTPEHERELAHIRRFARECGQQDFYRRLSLTPAATLGQIHLRYREFSGLYHPDRAGEYHLRTAQRELAEAQGALQEAYETLISPEKRARYDATLKAGRAGAAEGSREERQARARRELVQANIERAQALQRAGEWGPAIQLLEQAVRFEPQADVLLMLARLELRNPMWAQRALDHLRQAVTLVPELTEAWLELAAFWGRRGQVDRQRECLERILAYDPANREAQAARADTGRHRGTH